MEETVENVYCLQSGVFSGYIVSCRGVDIVKSSIWLVKMTAFVFNLRWPAQCKRLHSHLKEISWQIWFLRWAKTWRRRRYLVLLRHFLNVTGAFGEFDSVAGREVPCYLPRSLLHQVDQTFLKENIVYCKSWLNLLQAELKSFYWRTFFI